MTMTTERLCLCGCNEALLPSNKSGYKRGHKLRDAMNHLTPLPGPDDDLDGDEDIDAGDAIPDDPDPEPEDDLDVPGWLSDPSIPAPVDEPEVPADRPPGRLSDKGRPGPAPKPKGAKVTAATRKDVLAKIRFVLKPAAELWAIRDRLCGVVAVEQEPEISDSVAEIVCDSPDLLAFFTGPTGGFMKYFRLGMALQPVVFTAYAHHVIHQSHQGRLRGEPCGVCGAGPRDRCRELAGPAQPPQRPAYAA